MIVDRKSPRKECAVCEKGLDVRRFVNCMECYNVIVTKLHKSNDKLKKTRKKLRELKKEIANGK